MIKLVKLYIHVVAVRLIVSENLSKNSEKTVLCREVKIKQQKNIIWPIVGVAIHNNYVL